MEKQTKILLGVGAIIAAYLILKPKKADIQTSVVTKNTKVCPEGQKLVDMTCIVAPCPSMCMPIRKTSVMPADWSLVELQKQTSF